MKKMNIRKLLLLVIPWLHCALLFAPLFALAALFFNNHSSAYYLTEGLLTVIPIGILDISSRRCKYLWQYLFTAGIVCVTAFFVTDYYIIAVSLVIMAVARLVSRVRTTEKDLVFDRPYLMAPVVFIVPFFLSGIYERPVIQLASLCFVALYFVLWFTYMGLGRLEDYVEINRSMWNFPKKRILKTGTAILLCSAVFLLALALPSLILNFSFTKINMDPKAVRAAVQQTEAPTVADNAPDFRTLLPGTKQLPPQLSAFLQILGNVVLTLVLVFVALLILYGIYRLTKEFRGTVREKNDLIESTADMPEFFRTSLGKNRKKNLRFLDFSPNATARKKYIRAVKGAKKALPEEWLSPSEIEEQAGMNRPALHDVYEKARYSQAGVTRDDLENLNS